MKTCDFCRKFTNNFITIQKKTKKNKKKRPINYKLNELNKLAIFIIIF